jgi:hypothetical protein
MLPRHSGGRPYYIADLDFENNRMFEFQDQFYQACAEFLYQDIVQLSRALGVHPRTVSRWKNKETFPRYEIAVAIIQWVEQGKPNTKVYQSEFEVSML